MLGAGGKYCNDRPVYFMQQIHAGHSAEPQFYAGRGEACRCCKIVRGKSIWGGLCRRCANAQMLLEAKLRFDLLEIQRLAEEMRELLDDLNLGKVDDWHFRELARPVHRRPSLRQQVFRLAFRRPRVLHRGRIKTQGRARIVRAGHLAGRRAA